MAVVQQLPRILNSIKAHWNRTRYNCGSAWRPETGMNSIMNPVQPLADNFVLLFYDQHGGVKSTLPENTELL